MRLMLPMAGRLLKGLLALTLFETRRCDGVPSLATACIGAQALRVINLSSVFLGTLEPLDQGVTVTVLRMSSAGHRFIRRGAL